MRFFNNAYQERIIENLRTEVKSLRNDLIDLKYTDVSEAAGLQIYYRKPSFEGGSEGEKVKVARVVEAILIHLNLDISEQPHKTIVVSK